MLNGQLPPQSIIEKINMEVVKVSADGAGLHLHPDYIVGDMDSTNFSDRDNKYHKISDQTTTDFEKCLNFVQKKKLYPTLVLAIAGGEIDHAINNFMIFMSTSYPLYFLDYAQILKLGIAVRVSIRLQLPEYSIVTILPFFSATVSTKGLDWELCNTKLRYNGLRSARNKNMTKNIEINVHEGQVLVIAEVKNFSVLKNIKVKK